MIYDLYDNQYFSSQVASPVFAKQGQQILFNQPVSTVHQSKANSGRDAMANLNSDIKFGNAVPMAQLNKR